MTEKEVHTDVEICKGCGLCIFYCPRDVLRLSREPNRKGYTVVEVYQNSDCIGCRQCEANCPDLAIYVST